MFNREPTKYELAIATLRHVQDLDSRIEQLEQAIANSKECMDSYLEMASQEEEAMSANTAHLRALSAERSKYGSPAAYQELVFRLREST